MDRRMGRKRKRAAVASTKASTKARRPNTSSNAAKNSDKSKLKKRRAIPEVLDENKTQPSGGLSEEERTKSLDDRLSQIQCQIDSYLRMSSEDRFSVLPSLDLMLSIEDIIKELPIHSAITRLKKFLHVLLIAARKGCDERQNRLGAGTQSLVRTLVTMSTGACISVPEERDRRRTLRSVFRTNGKDQLTRIELEATSRAGKWALELLTSCVRGEGETRNEGTDDLQASLRHGDTTRVFVAPRDSLDKVMAENYLCSVVKRVGDLARSNDVPVNEVVSVLGVIYEELRPVIADPFFKPVLEAVLICSSRIQVPLLTIGTGKVGRDEFFLLPDFLRESIRTERTDTMFYRLSPDARHALLKTSNQAWCLHLHAVGRQFRNSITLTSAKAERVAVSGLAHVAAEEVHRHWEFMDELRREISSDTEPFSIGLWKKRCFYRAVLGEIADIVCQSQILARSEKESYKTVPLFKRFPPRYRQLVHTTTLLTVAIIRGEKGEWNEAAGPKGLDAVFQLQHLDRSGNLSPNAHAALLCIERLLERLCWASAYAMANGQGAKDLQASEPRISYMICKLSSMLEVIRLPGGEWAEGEETVQRRGDAMNTVLEHICKRKQLPSKRNGEWRVSGLFAMTICGIMCGTIITGMSKFCEFLDDAERYEVRRALELSREMAGNKVFGEVESAYRTLLQKTTKSLERVNELREDVA